MHVHVDPQIQDESHDISQEEFVTAFQQLATKAMAMSRKGPGNLLEVFCYDYGPGAYESA